MNKNIEQQLEKHGSLVYTNVGDSMMPLLRQNRDLMVIRAKGQERCRKYDAVLYRRPAGEYVMHRILKVCPDSYVICGDNRWAREKGVPEEWILGVLTAVVRDGKEIPVTDWRYQLYVHLWCDLFWVRYAILRTRSILNRLKRKLRR